MNYLVIASLSLHKNYPDYTHVSFTWEEYAIQTPACGGREQEAGNLAGVLKYRFSARPSLKLIS